MALLSITSKKFLMKIQKYFAVKRSLGSNFYGRNPRKDCYKEKYKCSIRAYSSRQGEAQSDVRVGDMRVGDMRVCDVRVCDMRVGDMRVCDMRVCDGWQARARRAEAAWRAIAATRRGGSMASHATT
ncbi:MAG: hypothetical protein JWR40_4861, partial [Massilia sp.]|nr:hypothetical protein [Massilia sp.]